VPPTGLNSTDTFAVAALALAGVLLVLTALLARRRRGTGAPPVAIGPTP
jgi:hypothetical protein